MTIFWWNTVQFVGRQLISRDFLHSKQIVDEGGIKSTKRTFVILQNFNCFDIECMGNQLVSKIILQISKARSWRWKLKKCKQFDNDPMEHGAWVFNSLHFVDTVHSPLLIWNIAPEVYITTCYKMQESDSAEPHSCKCYAAGTPQCLLCFEKNLRNIFENVYLRNIF